MSSNNVSIANALFTKTQQKVLGLLFGCPEQSFYLLEIIRLTRGGRGAVQRELNKLVDAGLVTRHSRGNQDHFQANHDSPVYDDLLSLVTKTFGVRDVLRTALSEVLSGVSVAFVYGSIAKGSADAHSDVDVLLVGDDLSYSDVLGKLEVAGNRLGRQVNPTIYTREEFRRRQHERQSFVTRVLEGPRIDLLAES